MIKRNLVAVFFLFSGFAFGQLRERLYMRELEGISNQWHKIILPSDIYGKTNNDFSDLRIYGLTSTDTIEAPYFLQAAVTKISDIAINFKVINSSYNEKGHYFTFEVPKKETINKILLDFKQPNFDWKITVEGSQDQSEWFTIAENFRILSIKNKDVDFKFTDVDLSASNYRYYRVFVPSKEKPHMTGAKISNEIITLGTFVNYPVQQTEIHENKKSKQTEIIVNLSLPVPVAFLKINCKNAYDYYRPVSIEYVTDSVKTFKGWSYNYRELCSGTVHSLEKNEFKCNSTILQKIKITIDNQDNLPLSISTIEVKGYEHSLIARFTEKADYLLAYGNKVTNAPQYDILQFANKIPSNLTLLELGKEEKISKLSATAEKPMFENKMWLWLIMGIIIVLLGGFSLSMMNKK